jgi:hypothetical protein
MQCPAYGLRGLVTIKTAVFVISTCSFTEARTSPEWRPFGASSALIAALFPEICGSRSICCKVGLAYLSRDMSEALG